jgi:hypothetical protein
MPEVYVVGDVFNVTEDHYSFVSRNVLELCAESAELHGSRSFMMTELPMLGLGCLKNVGKFGFLGN